MATTKRIYTRRDIIELIYNEYPSDEPEMKKAIQKCVMHFIKMDEEKFMEYVNEHSSFLLERLRKNTYYLR